MFNPKLEILRKKYPRFIYRNYSCKISGGNLKISFFFEIPPDINFHPSIIIKNIPESFQPVLLDNLIFHLGLIEMLSYWKVTSSPEIIIEAGFLNKEQINWWQNLIIKGMGQFFCENKLPLKKPEIISNSDNNKYTPAGSLLNDRYLVPFAGGRDSIVTLESLKKQGKAISLFTVNTVPKIQKVVKVSGIRKQILVERLIDKKLLALNKKRLFFNGHTPFTSLLSFISLLCAVIFDYKNIVFSNEKSADEGNVRYLGKIVNHQWAKSSEFEKMFRLYCQKYLVKNINYFSYLRNYGELEISKILTRYPRYFPVFSSCNAGMRIGSRGALQAKKRWCGKCPKCLFVYLSFYPLLKKEELRKIFGKDLFDPSKISEQEKLLPIMKSLMGRGSHKPFECVGTYEESRKAFKLSFEKARRSGKIPLLLKC